MDEERNSAPGEWWIPAGATAAAPQGLGSRVSRRHPRVPETELPRAERRCSAREEGKFTVGWRRGRGWLCAVALLASAGLCGGQTRIDDCRSAVPTSVVEAGCPDGADRYRYFKVTISGKALEAYTSIITPSAAMCSGTGSDFLCTAPTNAITAYDVQVGQGCRPNVDNNNFQDRSDRFSKQILICNPCKEGEEYWISIRPISTSKPCDFKLFVPKVNVTVAAPADCAFIANPAGSVVIAAPVCTLGLVRGVKAVEPTCINSDGFACLFGSCGYWTWLFLSLLTGLFPGIISLILFCVCWRRMQVQQFEADEEISYANNVLLTKKKDARKKYDAGSDDSDNDGEDVPPSFFVTDADF
ncbi:hypothetical protein T484DRAFT_1939743, partial [Baffinella frigidus]